MAAKKERPAPAKAPRTRTTTKTQASFGAYARAEVSAGELRKLVSEAAYYRAKQRGFTPGHEEEDWIQAEAEVLRRIGGDQVKRPQ